MELLTQLQVIKELNKYKYKIITKQAFYDRVKKGQIKIHYKSISKKKFYKLGEVAKVYGIKIGEIDSTTPRDVKNDEELYNPKNLEQLNKLLQDTDTPMIEVSVIDTFWAGKIKELKYKENNRELIPMHEALGVMQIAITNFKSKMYEIPHQLKAQYPDASSDMIDELHLMIDKAFYEFSKASIQQ